MGEPISTYLDAELYLPSCERARFSWGGRDYEGEPHLGEERLLDLAELEYEPERYGAELFGSVFPLGSPLRRGLQEAILEVERTKRRLHFHLHLSPSLPDRVHALYWELLLDPEHKLALARSPDTAFSRYGALSRAPGVPAAARPRLLCVVAAPFDLERYKMAAIDREAILHHFAAAVAELAEEIEITVLEPPATLGRLRDRLVADGGFHLLHFFGHGSAQSKGGSALVLEDDDGRARFIDEQLLAEAFLGDRELRLVTLVACHGGAPSSEQIWSGLAGRLVERGIPAVIAMRRAVSVAHAKVFVTHLYRHVARTGQVDTAVNEARQQLFLAEPKGIAWSSPVLFQRLADGRLWLADGEDEAAGRRAGLRISWRRLRHPLPWAPAFLWLLWTLAAFWPAPRAEVEMEIHASGLSFRLAKAQRLLDTLPLEGISFQLPARLTLPASLPTVSAEGKGGSLTLVKGDGAGSYLSFQAPLLRAGTEVLLDHEGEEEYHLGFSRSAETFQITLHGEATFKPSRGPRTAAFFAHPDSLFLIPRGRTLDLRLLFANFSEKAFEDEIEVDRLSLSRIEEEHSTGAARVKKESTLLSGEVRVPAADKRYRLQKGESLSFATAQGSLNGLRLGPDGLRFGWRGRVSTLTKTAAGGTPKNLVPAALDLAVAPARQGSLGKLLAVLALAFPSVAIFVPGSRSTPKRTA